jgi:hypothetical protein
MPAPTPFGPRTAAACLVGAPVLLLASHLLQPAHGAETRTEVAAQASHPGAFQASTAVGLLAMLLLVPALVALGGLLGDRWSGRVGGPMAVAGAIGLCFLLGTGVGATAIAVHAGPDAVRLTEELEGDPAFGLGVALMLLGWTLGLVTLGIGFLRSRRLPVWAGAGLVVAPLVPAFAGGKVPVAVGFVVLLACFAAAAAAVVRGQVPARTPEAALV